MRWLFRNALVIALLAVVGVFLGSRMPGRKATSSLVGDCILDSVRMEEVTVEYAVKYLEGEIRKTNPRLRNFRVVLPNTERHPYLSEVRISLEVKGVTGSEALIYVANQMGAWPHYSAGWVQMWPIRGGEPQYSQTWMESYVTERSVLRGLR